MSRKTFLRPLAVGAAALALSTTLTGCFNDPPKAAPRITVTETPDPKAEWTLNETEQQQALKAYEGYWKAIRDAGSIPRNELLGYFKGVAEDDEAQTLAGVEGLNRSRKSPGSTTREIHARIIQNSPATAMIYDCQVVTSTIPNTPPSRKQGWVADMLKGTDNTWRVVATSEETKACENQ